MMSHLRHMETTEWLWRYPVCFNPSNFDFQNPGSCFKILSWFWDDLKILGFEMSEKPKEIVY